MNGFWRKWRRLWLIVFLLLIPTQLGRHFWFDWSRVAGIRVDYLSPVLYIADLSWILWIGGEVLARKKLKLKKWFSFEIGVVVVLILLNILVSASKWVAVYRWIRLIQWWITYKIIRAERMDVRKLVMVVVPCWVLVESMLGWSQIVKGESLNGWWYWLGERRFSFTTIGIAQISVWGQGMVRAYGTFSHPNSMAGFLIVTLWLWMWQKNRIGSRWWWTVLWFNILGIVVSGSRTIWLLTGLLFLSKIPNLRVIKQVVGYGLIGIGILIIMFNLIEVNYTRDSFLGGWDSDGLSKRINLNMIAVRMVKENLMLGVGAGNFLVRLPEYQAENHFYWLQPVHNILLLMMAEMGILGMLLIGWIFRDKLKMRYIKNNLMIIGIIGISGMVDHYWITLPQNMWLLVLVLGII